MPGDSKLLPITLEDGGQVLQITDTTGEVLQVTVHNHHHHNHVLPIEVGGGHHDEDVLPVKTEEVLNIQVILINLQ